jgi:predicted CXXCH cytochrome family protein
VLADCKVCHVEEETSEALPPKILLETSTPLNNFILHIENLEKDKTYKAELILSNEDNNQSEPFILKVIPSKAKDYSNRFKPLKSLSEVLPEEIKRGVFMSVTLFWETDTPATTSVECHKKDSEESPVRIEDSEIYSWTHRIKVSGLSYKNIYICKAISEDLFGNRVESSEIIIDTSKEKAGKETDLDITVKPALKKAEFFRIEGREGIFLWIEANIPSYCYISFSEREEKPEEVVRHFTLGRYATIEACENCHTFTVSHPIGVKATEENVRIAEDMFTIEDGIITCATCHSPHGSDKPFLARFDFRKDLCLKCHDESIYTK